MAAPRPPSRHAGPLTATFLGLSLALLVGGSLARLAGTSTAAHAMWAVATVAGLCAAAVWVWSSAREGRIGVDLIAVLALAGSLAVGEYLAGAVITVMLATGRDPRGTGSRARAPAICVRCWSGRRASRTGCEDGDAHIAAARGGRPRRPADGAAGRGRARRRSCSSARVAVLDESALTGESLPVERAAGRRRPERGGQRRGRLRPAGHRRPRQRAPTPGSSGWSSEAEAAQARRSSGWRTATPSLFVAVSVALAGRRLAALGRSRCARWRSWSWPRPAR